MIKISANSLLRQNSYRFIVSKGVGSNIILYFITEMLLVKRKGTKTCITISFMLSRAIIRLPVDCSREHETNSNKVFLSKILTNF